MQKQNKQEQFEEYVNGTIGYGKNREVEVKAIVRKHKDLISQSRQEAVEKIEKLRVDSDKFISIAHPTIQATDGYNEAIDDAIKSLSSKDK